MRQRRLILILLMASWQNAANAESEISKLVAEPDPTIQAQIDAAYHSPSDVEAFQQAQTLKELSDDKAELVKQLAIFAATSQTEEEFHILLTLRILHLLDLQPSIPIRVLAPYLNSENEPLRDFAREWFQGYDKAVGEDPLKAYRSYVTGRLARNEEVPVAFIEYVYDRLPPGKALEVFHFGRWPPQKKDSEVLLAEHIVSNAIWLKENKFAERFQAALPEANDELAKLAKHDEWWVRLYVVEIMRQHRELRQDEVIQSLSKDSNPIVAKIAQGRGQ